MKENKKPNFDFLKRNSLTYFGVLKFRVNLETITMATIIISQISNGSVEAIDSNGYILIQTQQRDLYYYLKKYPFHLPTQSKYDNSINLRRSSVYEIWKWLILKQTQQVLNVSINKNWIISLEMWASQKSFLNYFRPD